MELAVTGERNGIPEVDLDLFDAAYLHHPEATWAALRDLAPVVWINESEGVTGRYVFARYEEVKVGQSDWRRFTTAAGAGIFDIRRPDNYRPPSVIVEVDPPRHTEVRKAVNKAIAPTTVRTWRERFEFDAEAMVAPLIEAGRCDGVHDVAEAFVCKVFPDSMGVEINAEQAVAVGDLNFNGIGPKNQRFEEAAKKVEPFLEWWHSSLAGETVRPGGFGEQLLNMEKAGEIEKGLASGPTRTFLRGGLDTTISSIGSALWLFALHPEQWDLLRARPELLRGAFDETLRLESPISTNFRTSTGPTELSGLPIEGDRKIQLLLGAANRDPRRFSDPDPERFDITRANAGTHVAFGTGIHACVGQLIARMEFDCIIKALAKHVKRFELEAAPTHRINNALRTLADLPLRLVLR